MICGWFVDIGDIRGSEANSFVQVTGTIVRTGGVRILEQSRQVGREEPWIPATPHYE